jgi:hypothetical protein
MELNTMENIRGPDMEIVFISAEDFIEMFFNRNYFRTIRIYT